MLCRSCSWALACAFVVACGGSGRSSSLPEEAHSSASEEGSAERVCDHRGDAEPSKLSGMTAAHNAIRCALERPAGGAIPPLSWSSSVAAEAQAYADQLARGGCKLQHSNTSHGENLFAGTGTYTAADVVERWAGEERCFDYGDFPESCSCTCGHYTQLVWADTQRLGCGMASCPDGTEVWVCQYDPAGNYRGMKPY